MITPASAPELVTRVGPQDADVDGSAEASALRKEWLSEGLHEPDPVAQWDAVDHQVVRVAGLGPERVAIDPAETEATSLVEAQVSDVGRSGRHDQPGVSSGAQRGDGVVDQLSPDPGPPHRRRHGHVLQLDLSVLLGVDQLEVSHDLASEPGDEDPALVQVRVELGRRVLGLLEESPQQGPVAVVPVDP